MSTASGKTYQQNKKKLKSAGFAAKVDRYEISTGIDLLGVDQTEHIRFIIDVLKRHKDELDI